MGSHGRQGPSSNASAGPGKGNPLYPILKQFPPLQMKRGDHKLQRAREITHEFESDISQDDHNIIKERITYAEEIKIQVGSGSKPGFFSKFQQAREYRRAARNAYRYAKGASARALRGREEANPFQLLGPSLAPSSEDVFNRVISAARPLYRCYLSCEDAFPSLDTKAEWLDDVWCDACERIGVEPSSMALPHVNEFVVSSTTFLTNMKTRITRFVQSLYGFNTSRASGSVDYNARLAHALLNNMTFIYREPNIHGTRYPYQHPIIQNAINMMWFQNNDGDGIVFHDHFTPIPIQAIALALTVIECCIDEWTNGTYTVSDWNEDRYRGVYHSHISSLFDLKDHGHPPGVDLLGKVQSELLKNARVHAGAPPEPVTGAGRLHRGSMNTAINEGVRRAF